MKKTLTILLFSIILVFPCFASQPLFRLGVGANIGYDRLAIVDEASRFPIHLVKEGKITIGLESRMSVKYLLADLVGELSVLDRQHLYFSGILAVGPTVDIAEMASISIAWGPKIQYVIEDRGPAKNVTSEGETESLGFADVVKEGMFNWRFMFDFLAGPVMRVGIAYTFPTGFSINQHNIVDIFPAWESIAESAQTTVCIQMQLI